MAKRVRTGAAILPWVLKGFGVVAAGIVLALFWRNGIPSIRHGLRNLGGGYQNLYADQHAPGTDELRADAKCQLVTISSPAERALQRAQHPQRTPSTHPMADDASLIMCMPYVLRDPPSCDLLARTYVGAVHPSAAFRIVVEGKPGASSNICLIDYDSSGKRLPNASLDAGQ